MQKKSQQIITHTINHKENYHSRKLPILGRWLMTKRKIILWQFMNLLSGEPTQSHFQIILVEITYFRNARNCFFPKTFLNLGNFIIWDVKLGNFKCDIIQDVYSFNLTNYIKANKQTKTRLKVCHPSNWLKVWIAQ